MLFRALLFISVLVVGGAAGYAVAPTWGLSTGLVVAAAAWFLLDLTCGLRVAHWLRRSEDMPPPRLGGLWGEIVDRARRALRARDEQAAQARSRLQEFLAAIQASPNGVVLIDSEGRIEWCNLTAAAHFGFDMERDVAQLLVNLVRDPAFTHYIAGGDFSQEVVVPGRHGTPSRPARVSLRLHPYGEGRKLMLSRDVTQVEQAETMRRDFVANVSHEIRTPLTVLAGFVETLQTLPLEEAERARYLGLMSQQAQRVQALVNDLLTLSRLEGGPPPGPNDWIALSGLQAPVEEEARALAGLLAKPLSLRIAPPPALSLAVAVGEIQSAMSNFLSNAIRYTPADGSIDAGWRLLPDGRAEFSVRDTGAGIAPEHIPRLTERFYRVDRSRSRETGGTGLGLAIVKHVVQRHGGELRIESQLGAGSTFAFTLPASRVRAD